MSLKTLKVRFNVIALVAYLFPAIMYLLLTDLSRYDYYNKSILAVKLSVALSILGFILGYYFSINASFKMRNFSNKFYLNLSKLFVLTAILSISLQLAKIGIPLFRNDLRTSLQQGVLWNIFTFSSIIGLFFSSYVYFFLNARINNVFKILILILILLTLLTGWKGTLINYLLILTTYSILYKRIKLALVLKIITVFLILFFGINALRTGIYTISFVELFNYLYYGFENFVRISPFYSSECLHSIPLLNCPFTYDNDLLIFSTFNVYTGLMPIFADGGLYAISFVFFIFGFLLSFLRNLKNSFSVTFFFYLMHYFFLIAHNGYIFNSSSFVVILLILIIIDVVRIK